MKVGIIGAGNVGTHLAKGLHQAGVEVAVIYSRTITATEQLVVQVPAATPTNSLDLLQAPLADIYLLTVPDQALPEVIQHAKFPPQALIAHTSGTQSLDVLASLQQAGIGVFYPLQTFSKEKEIDWKQIPICIEASSPEAEEQLQTLGRQLSQRVLLMPGATRRQLHLAAVFACNFTNHLWGVAQEILQQAALPVNVLEPLVEETRQKAFQYPPFSMQTGPAQRNDLSTIQAHLQLLQASPQYQQLYEVLTQSIQVTAQHKPTSKE